MSGLQSIICTYPLETSNRGEVLRSLSWKNSQAMSGVPRRKIPGDISTIFQSSKNADAAVKPKQGSILILVKLEKEK